MPQTVYDVGDPITSRLKLGVTPDQTTTVTATVYRPDGSTISGLTVLPTWTGTDGDEKTVQFYATDDGTAAGTSLVAAGDWLVIWRVVGTGASVTPKVYNVTPLPGTTTRPAWSPFLSDVADYAPLLTVDLRTPGNQYVLGTFTGWTAPTDEQAQRHIDAAVSIVGAGFGTLTGQLPRMARSVAAVWAAATLSRAFARDADARAAADALSRQATAELAALTTAVENASESTLNAVPVVIAPLPVPWGDQLPLGVAGDKGVIWKNLWRE